LPRRKGEAILNRYLKVKKRNTIFLQASLGGKKGGLALEKKGVLVARGEKKGGEDAY